MKRFVLLVAFVCLASNAYGGTLVWKTSKTEAVSAAISEGKKILLLAGRETCGNCSYMKNTVCESISPAIKTLIQQKFVLWFCDVDASSDWYTYASGLGSFYLPLMCCIDPNNPDTYLDRTTGIQSPDEFYARLLAIGGPPQDLKGDFDGNGMLGLEDVIGILQILSGMRGK
jgi:hypothetical protein